MKNIRFPLILCGLFLVFFVFGKGWYDPAELIIRGKVTGENGALEVRWDSGAGYNSYESRQFRLKSFVSQEQGRHELVIRRQGGNNSASLSKDVFIERIAADGRNLDFLAISQQYGLSRQDSSLRLSENNAVLALQVEADESITVDMLTNNTSGKVSVGVDGVFKERDLYAANEKSTHAGFDHWLLGKSGEFVVRMVLPRYLVRKLLVKNDGPQGQLTLASIEVKTAQDTVTIYSGDKDPVSALTLPGQSALQKRYFKISQCIQHIFFAVISTWIVMALVRLFKACGGISGIFAGKRRVFWLFLGGSLPVYSAWLLVFWPGVASIDSLKIWRAALLPDVYLNDHPFLNVLLYRYLAHFWNNIAVVPLFHIVMLAVLVASIFYSLYCRKVPLKMLLPFYLLLIFSLPIGLYNTILWKDIPFALIIVFWGYAFVNLYLQKIEGTLRYSKEQIVVFLLLLFAVALIRHNGAVYLLVIPLYFVLLRLVPIRIAIAVALTGAGVLALALVILVKGGLISDGGYVLSQGLEFFHNMLGKSFPDLCLATWKNYWGIFNINQTVSKWDLWHYYLGDRTAYQFLKDTGWNDVFHYLPQRQAVIPFFTDIAMRLYNTSYQIPFVYMTWNALHFLGLYGLAIVFFRWLPLTAIFSSFILIQILTLLVFVDVMNWRYYYFAFLGGYLLIPLMLLDIQRRREKKSGESRLQDAV